MQKGVANGSFGIEVAKLAQLPKPIINRSQEILDELVENVDKPKNSAMTVSVHSAHDSDTRYDALVNGYQQLTEQYHLLQQKMSHATAVMQQLTNIDYEQLSPKAAFDLLWQLKEQQ
jgi:DNA mismatch repair ATPase MutS